MKLPSIIPDVDSSQVRRACSSQRIGHQFGSGTLLPSHNYVSSSFQPKLLKFNGENCSSAGSPTSSTFKPIAQRKANDTSLSPSVKKRLEEEKVIERIKTKTPEVPDSSSLPISVSMSNLADATEKFLTSHQSEPNLNGVRRTSSFYRRERIHSLEQKGRGKSATTERIQRNTDSMLEDVAIAKQLKRRLTSRWQQITKRTINNSGLSDFLKKSIMEGSLDALAAVKPTSNRRHNAAKIAMEACMGGYFSNMENDDLRKRLQTLFAECLHREEFCKDDFICFENEVGNKVYVIEEGSVLFLISGQVAGYGHHGSSFGELCLVYGVHRQASVKAITDCVIAWSIDDLSFRRIQATVALCSLKQSKSNFFNTFPKRASSLSDLQESGKRENNEIHISKIQKESRIGKGTFGSVYMVSVRDSNGEKKNQKKRYALKCMSKRSIVNNNNEKRVLIEKNALQAVAGSEFIVSFISAYQDDKSIYFLHEFVQGGNLLTFMIERNILSHSESLFFCANISMALIHMHRKGFIHRDIKPENCLIGRDGYLKVCDLGMAKRMPSTIMLPNGGIEVVSLAFTLCGTPEFMAPEFLLSTGYDKGVDWWALGCILVEMYTGRSPFEFEGDLKKTFKEVCLVGMGKKSIELCSILTRPEMSCTATFIHRLLSKFDTRIGRCDSVFSHDYFRDINVKKLKKKIIDAPYKPKLSAEDDIHYFDVDDDEDEVQSFHGNTDWCYDICNDNYRDEIFNKNDIN